MDPGTYVDYCFEMDIAVLSGFNEISAKKIANRLNALMNTSGGLIVLRVADGPLSITNVIKWQIRFQCYVNDTCLGNQGLRSLVEIHHKVIADQHYSILFVFKSSKLVTFSYNAYVSHDAGQERITSDDVAKQIMQMADNEPQEKPRSRLADLQAEIGSFTMGEQLPVEYWEGATMGYKHSRSVRKFSAMEIAQKLERSLLVTISAFANTRGGSLLVGVDDKSGVIGYHLPDSQEEEEEEERKLTQYINTELRKCIWNGKKPDHDRYWKVFYYDVNSWGGGRRCQVREAKRSAECFETHRNIGSSSPRRNVC